MLSVPARSQIPLFLPGYMLSSLSSPARSTTKSSRYQRSHNPVSMPVRVKGKTDQEGTSYPLLLSLLLLYTIMKQTSIHTCVTFPSHLFSPLILLVIPLLPPSPLRRKDWESFISCLLVSSSAICKENQANPTPEPEKERFKRSTTTTTFSSLTPPAEQ